MYISVVAPTGASTLTTCDFESGLCGFTNERSGDVFDWKKQAGRTVSANTGPSSDHTLGTTSGKSLLCKLYLKQVLYRASLVLVAYLFVS